MGEDVAWPSWPCAATGGTPVLRRGGAALGALIGAIAGKGKGAAVGGAIGAGAGTAVQASTKGEQVQIPPETKLDFTLKAPLTLTM